MNRIQPGQRPLSNPRIFVGARIAVLCAVSFVAGTVIPSGNAASPSTGGSPSASAPASPSASAPASPGVSASPIPSASASASPSASPPASGCPSADPNFWPFGVVCGRDFNVPSPPEAPSLIPTITTKTTTRIWGTDPFQQAVSVTQHIFPAAISVNDPNETNNVPDRPWGLTLITPDDPLTGISAVPLLHFPDDAPILFVTADGIPDVTLNEIKRLGDTGIVRANNIDAFLVGAAANAAVEAQLTAIGLTFLEVTGADVFELSNNIDKLYGSIQNPDEGVPQMGISASSSGNGMQDVFIGSADGNDWQFYLGATHWASHMPTGLLWTHRDSIPAPTIKALKRRNGHALIYVWGSAAQVSASVIKQLNKYGVVQRIDADDPVAFNTPAVTTPVNISIAFAKMFDPSGNVGWGELGPGHGFTLVNVNDWQGAVASAPLSHLGFHAPLLVTDSSTTLPAAMDAYYMSVAPTFLTSPGEGPYNMTYVIGDWDTLTWPLQAHVDYISEMSNRRVWNNNTGGRYSNSGQP
jgi:hypothetical protein